MTVRHPRRTGHSPLRAGVRSAVRPSLPTPVTPAPITRPLFGFLVPAEVLSAPLWLAVAATRTPEFRDTECPVALVGNRAWFFVRAGAPLDTDLARLRGVGLASPTTARSLTWWIRPETTGHLPGDSAAIQAAMHAALH